MSTRITPHVRQLIIAFPDDSARGEVTRFCRNHGVSVASFYRIKARAATRGPETAVSPGSTAPKHPSRRTSDEVEEMVVSIRASLVKQGKDAGPISIADQMRVKGVEPPSRATLARILTRRGMVDPQPQKKPRAAWQRFCYPDPNGCWQLDGFDYTLDTGQKRCVLQVEDDHSRLICSSLAAPAETSNAAITVTDEAIRRHGAPAFFLTDNGSAFNLSRRGQETSFEKYLKCHGVTPITGRPGHPTTQGKNERLHQTTQKFLDANRPIYTTERLQTLLNDFEDWYNNHRVHQSLDGQTPAQAYHATPKAQPAPAPITTPTPVKTWIPRRRETRPRTPKDSTPIPGTEATYETSRRVDTHGHISICHVRVTVGRPLAGQTMHIIFDDHTITVIDPDGVILGDVPRPTLDTRKTRTDYSITPRKPGQHGPQYR